MEKKKRIVSKLIFALVIAVIVSMCYVGTTLARYATGDTGSATTSIAKWSLSFGENVSTTPVSFDSLSPASDAFGSDSGTDRSNTTGLKLIATLTYDIGVDADVTITLEKGTEPDAGVKFNYVKVGATSNEEPEFGSTAWSRGTVINDSTAAPARSDVDGLFSVSLAYNTTKSTTGTTLITDGTAFEITAGTGTLYLYASVTWTSADTRLGSATISDALDTWVGENVASVGFNISYSAVQASEAPATT